jgi:hypothetical protein
MFFFFANTAAPTPLFPAPKTVIFFKLFITLILELQ